MKLLLFLLIMEMEYITFQEHLIIFHVEFNQSHSAYPKKVYSYEHRPERPQESGGPNSYHSESKYHRLLSAAPN